jgi:hypothetical protein
MSPVEKLFCLEIEFHRRLRMQALGTADAGALHTSYEPLIRAAGRVTGRDVELIGQRHAMAADARDLLAARESLKQLLGLSQLG